ncbi:hypothetical protein PHJA_000812000 [Phtheirospermum japonicum]|uniref:Uncharacterized protein n=1 Tax=Phtheirospermum japonicum TaxID=374723 RepID=A0A830BKF7_9LAMI|nr:hypothetical protein PHJA_000812000 [Phtheirospermum japonicum]
MLVIVVDVFVVAKIKQLFSASCENGSCLVLLVLGQPVYSAFSSSDEVYLDSVEFVDFFGNAKRQSVVILPRRQGVRLGFPKPRGSGVDR